MTVALFLCSAGISTAAGPAPAASGSGGGGGHAAAAPPSTPAAAPAAQAAPSAPVQAAPHANPTTPAGSAPAAVHAVQPQQAPVTPSAATDNGATRNHRHQDRNLQYQTNYGNFYIPDNQSYEEFGNNGTGNNASTSDNSAPAVVTPAPAPVTPTDNSTSVAAQTDNAVNHSPAVVSVSDEIQRAQAAVDADRQRVIAQLADKPDYQQATARQKDAAKEMRDVKPLGAGVPGTPAPAVMDAASAKLDASDEVTKMQEAAIAADPQAAEDRDRLTKLIAERDTAEARMRSQH